MDVVWIYKPPVGRCLENNSFSLFESTLTVDIILLRSPARIVLTCPLPAYFNTYALYQCRGVRSPQKIVSVHHMHASHADHPRRSATPVYHAQIAFNGISKVSAPLAREMVISTDTTRSPL
jgi:hypothetical protein